MLRQDLEVHNIPFIPPIVDVADIDIETGRLVSLEEFEQYQSNVDDACDEQNSKFSKKKLNAKYSIAKIGDQYYAIYKGEHHGKLLGRGSFGSVKLAQNIHDGTWVVLKSLSVKKDHSVKEHTKIVAAEINILKKTNMFLGYYRVKDSSKGLRDVIAMPLARGISVKHVIRQRAMPAVKWIDLAIQMAEAAHEIHLLDLVHRDIKPENMLYDPSTAKVKLIDFGLTRPFAKDKAEYVGGRSGTNRYMAPEILSRKKKKYTYNQATEVYALGISFLESFNMSRDPQGIIGDVDFYAKIRNPFVRESLLKLVNKMLSSKPSKRPSFDVIIKRLKDLRAEHLDVISKVATLVYLDIAAYQKSTPKQRLHLIPALSDADEVLLLDTEGKFDPLVSLIIKHNLEKVGVFVANQVVSVFEPNKSNALDRLRGYTADRSGEMNVLYSAYFIKSLKNFTDNNGIRFARTVDRFIVSSKHKQMALDNINAQVDRIEKKDPHDQRLVLLCRFRDSIADAPDLNYRTLFSRLNDLQVLIDDVKKKVKKQRFMRFFGGQPTATAKVAETSRELVRDLNGLNYKNSSH